MLLPYPTPYLNEVLTGDPFVLYSATPPSPVLKLHADDDVAELGSDVDWADDDEEDLETPRGLPQAPAVVRPQGVPLINMGSLNTPVCWPLLDICSL